MDTQGNNNHYYKCPHCACIFLTQADLQTHVKRFGNLTNEHAEYYRRTHGRVEHGYGDE
jgi:uncharacterized C2H2 Zn-finger protein